MNKDWLCETVTRINKEKKVEAAIVYLSVENENLTRFARNCITQNTTRHRIKLYVTALWKRRRGSAVTSDLSPQGVLDAFKRAEDIAMTSPEDPEYTDLPGMQRYLDVPRFFPDTAELSPGVKAGVIKKIVDEASSRGMESAGIYRSGDYAVFMANTSGLIVEHKYTEAEFSVTASIADSSGSAVAQEEDAARIDPAAVAEEAFRTAESGRTPRELPPGRYPTLLSARAMGELMPFVVYQMDRRAADEGRSFFSSKLGTVIASDAISFYSDPADPRNPGWPIDFYNDGISRKREVFIESGVLRNLWTSRFWAEKQGIPVVSPPMHFTMKGGDKTLGELVSGMERGLVVNHLWYTRFVNPMDLLLTGTSRDGLFWVEDGKISHPVRHMRFNDSPLRILENPAALGAPERRNGSMLLPPVLSGDFEWSSTTTF